MFNYGVAAKQRGLADCDFFRRCNRNAPRSMTVTAGTTQTPSGAMMQQVPASDCACHAPDNSWLWILIALFVGYNLKGK